MNITDLYKETNSELINLCKSGKKEAFKELYNLYSKAMYNVCVRMLNNTNDAEDVLQESFISAFTHIHQYNQKASFGSWLKRIVINKCIDAIRERNDNLIPLNDKDIAVDEKMDEDVITYDVESVKNGIRQLPDGYRVIITLFLFEDYTHRMIADKLNISEGTSKSQYARARKKLVQLITLKNNNDER